MKSLPVYNSSFAGLIKGFDIAVRTKGYSNAEMYGTSIREFLFFLETKGLSDIKAVRSAEVIAYYEYLKIRPNQKREGVLSDSMIHHHLFSLHLFFDHLLDSGIIDALPARVKQQGKAAEREREILSIEEVKKVYSACETARDRALLSIAYGCGLRRSEIQKLDLSDVMLSSGSLIVREGKGGKYRSVTMSDKVIASLREYVLYERAACCIDHKGKKSDAFFIDEEGERIRGDVHNKRLKEIIKRTKDPGLIAKNITLHCLRHSIATHLLDNGAGIEFVQKFLGHAQMDTSLIYSRKRKQRLAIMQQAEKKR